MNAVLFCSEGPPHDSGSALSYEAVKAKRRLQKHSGAKVEIYTPRKLKKLNYHWHVRRRLVPGTIHPSNAGCAKSGCGAWKPLIISLELEKLSDGDLLLYHDCNTTKCPYYQNTFSMPSQYFSDLIDMCGSDFFCPRDHFKYIPARIHTKTIVLEELGENREFNKVFPACCSAMIVIKKSKGSVEFVKDWLACCEKERWVNYKSYGKWHMGFGHPTADQSLLTQLIANRIYKGGRQNIFPKNFPNVSFGHYSIKHTDRDTSLPVPVTDFPHLHLLDNFFIKLYKKLIK